MTHSVKAKKAKYNQADRHEHWYWEGWQRPSCIQQFPCPLHSVEMMERSVPIGRRRELWGHRPTPRTLVMRPLVKPSGGIKSIPEALLFNKHVRLSPRKPKQISRGRNNLLIDRYMLPWTSFPTGTLLVVSSSVVVFQISQSRIVWRLFIHSPVISTTYLLPGLFYGIDTHERRLNGSDDSGRVEHMPSSEWLFFSA